MSIDPHALKLYTDGNAYNNPGGTGGYACVAEWPESFGRATEIVFDRGFHETTNNRMELQGCIAALEWVGENYRMLGVERVQIITDSRYVHSNQNMPATWRRQQWKTSSGRPIENPDLWKAFLRARAQAGIRVDIVWHKGKKTEALRLVDKTAKAAGKAPAKHDRGFRGGKVARSKVAGGSSSLFPARGQDQTIRVYRTRLIGRAGNKVYFDVFDEARLEPTQKCAAYAPDSLINELHRQHSYRVRFNNDATNPMIVEILAVDPCPASHADKNND